MLPALLGWLSARFGLFESEVEADALHDVGDHGLGLHQELVSAEILGTLPVRWLR
jgi:hypothetical protein